MRKTVLLTSILLVAACNREQPAATAPAAEPAPQQQVAEPVAEAPKAAPGELKSPLPEGFVLPFAYHRLYDNTGKTEAGKPQRRVMVEFIGADAATATDALAAALAGKGFVEKSREQVDGKDQLVFERADGASVIVKIDPQPKRLRREDARGTLHLTWNSV
jgi:hypothetical protein